MSVIAGRTAIRTQAGVIDARRSRSPQGALLEMAALEMERQRLLAESDRMHRRANGRPMVGASNSADPGRPTISVLR